MKFLSRFGGASTTIMGFCGAAMMASAQSSVAPDMMAPTVLDPVFVTAQNRVEDAQDLPIVVASFSGDEIEELGVVTLQDLTQFIPGVELFDERGAGQPTWVIRGVGLADFNANNTPTASVYDDGVYLGSNVLSGLGLFDLDRIEVLKGPQSGLYGRNTTGGAVRYLPVLPEIGAAPSGYVQGSYGRRDAGNIEAAFGSGIGDRAAYRVSGLYAFGGGWQDSLATPQDDQGETVLSQPINRLDNEWSGLNLYLDYAFDGAEFQSITSMQSFDARQVFDFDASPLAFAHEDTQADFDIFSQTVRLASTTDSAWDWQIGVNYAQTELLENRQIDTIDNLLVLPVTGRRIFTQEDRHWAIFAESTYALTEQLRLNGSLRFTDETKDLVNFLLVLEADPFQIFVDDPGDTFLGPVNTAYELEDHWSGHIGFDYHMSEEALLYAKAVKAYKSGGFFGGFALSSNELEPYAEEIIWAYEAGAKFDLPEAQMRINGALFFYDYQDVQGYTTLIDENVGLVTRLGNLGDAEYHGAELELLWAPPALDGLTLAASATWLETEIVDSDEFDTSLLIDFVTGAPGDPEVVTAVEGQAVSFAPKFSYTLSGQYEHALSATWTAAAHVNWSSRSDFDRARTFVYDDGVYAHEGYGLLGAGVSLRSTNGWEAALIGRNLTNETYIHRATGDDLASFGQIPGRPINWTVQVSKTF